MKRWFWLIMASALVASIIVVACAVRARRAPTLAPTALPARILTDRGELDVEREYLPGVVDCELSHFTESAPALEAQAIAARTYLLTHLTDRGASARVPIGPHFQCWRPPVHERSARAASATRGLVLRHGGRPITGNYAAGASGLDDDCRPPPPHVFGYPAESWDALKKDWVQREKRHGGPAWTEIFVTDNRGLRGSDVSYSPLGARVAHNRGALGQHAAICLAERQELSREEILRRFYGEDVTIGE